MPDKLTLNVLLTKKCNADCHFCIEKTIENTKDSIDWKHFTKIINQLIKEELVSDVLLLGGEPLYFKGILNLIESLTLPPIVTTNGHRLIKDEIFLNKFNKLKIKALNISISHFDKQKRKELMNVKSFDNLDLKKTLKHIPFPLRINTLLIKNYIDSIDKIEEMAKFCKYVGAQELKVAELIGRNEKIHDFIHLDVIQFNSQNYVEIPDPLSREKCHLHGGSFLWKTIDNVKIFFNSPPDYSLSGGKDNEGNFYHRVLFNDGLLGYSWRRKDSVNP